MLAVSLNSNAQELDYDALKKEFTADTARVETAYRNAPNFSTLEMVEGLYNLEVGYDQLLNKYYKILLNHLNEDNKKALIATQRNWIQLRDSDRELVTALHRQTYDEGGGGTIWGIVAADARADITRNRVFELYRYLMFSYIGG